VQFCECIQLGRINDAETAEVYCTGYNMDYVDNVKFNLVLTIQLGTVELCPYSDVIHDRFMFWVTEILVHCLIFTVHKVTAVASYTHLPKLYVTHHFNKQLPLT
jgi:hypothetical protein